MIKLALENLEDVIKELRKKNPNCKYCGGKLPTDIHSVHCCKEMQISFRKGIEKLAEFYKKEDFKMYDVISAQNETIKAEKEIKKLFGI